MSELKLKTGSLSLEFSWEFHLTYMRLEWVINLDIPVIQPCKCLSFLKSVLIEYLFWCLFSSNASRISTQGAPILNPRPLWSSSKWKERRKKNAWDFRTKTESWVPSFQSTPYGSKPNWSQITSREAGKCRLPLGPRIGTG